MHGVYKHWASKEKNMPEIPSILDMFKAGLHFGHRASKRHPKMEPFIFGKKNSVHIINLEITQKKLKTALEFVEKIAAHGGTILFLGTKKQAQKIIKENALKCDSPYIIERWLGGTFTNFSEILKLIKKFIDLKKRKEEGELEKYTKKEQLHFDRDIEKLEKMVGGIERLKGLPDAIFILDIKKEKGAVREARGKSIPIVAVCDTNVNPEVVDYPIPANDDAIRGIIMIIELIRDAVNEGKKKEEKEKVESIEVKTSI